MDPWRNCSRSIVAIARRCARGSPSRIFWKSTHVRRRSGRGSPPLTSSLPKRAQGSSMSSLEDHEIRKAAFLVQALYNLGEQRGGGQDRDLLVGCGMIEAEWRDRVGNDHLVDRWIGEHVCCTLHE